MLSFLNIVILLLLLFIPGYLLIRLLVLRTDIFINLKYWMLLFGYCYILLPSFLIETTNQIQKWGFSNNTLIAAKLASIYFILALFCISFFTKDSMIGIIQPLKMSKFNSNTILAVWLAITLYSLFATGRASLALRELGGLDRVAMGNIFDGINAAYHLKSVLFFGFTIATVKYWEKGKILYFLPILIISASDVLAGGRTLLYFSIVGIYLNMAIKNRKLYLGRISILMGLLLVSVTASRMSAQAIDGSMTSLENYIYQSLGEFVQTFNTFCYSIENHFISRYPLSSMFTSAVQGILPGFIKAAMNLTDSMPGAVIAVKINRGYGLGFNILTEAFYYGKWLMLLLYPAGLLLVDALSKKLLRSKFPGFICFLYLAIYSRLFFREGLFSYILIPVYLFALYGIISLLWYKASILIIKKRGKNEQIKSISEKESTNSCIL